MHKAQTERMTAPRLLTAA